MTRNSLHSAMGAMTTSTLCMLLAKTDDPLAHHNKLDVAAVRGAILDLLEERNPRSFRLWLECDDTALFSNYRLWFC